MRADRQKMLDTTHEVYEEARRVARAAGCQSVTVEASTSLVINGHEHAGTVSHRCHLDQGHREQCSCLCGKYWMKHGSVK